MRTLLILIAAGALAVSCAAPNDADRAAAPPPSEAPPNDDVQADQRGPRGPRGETAPEFTVTTFTGEPFALGEQRGTPVVLNFWESW